MLALALALALAPVEHRVVSDEQTLMVSCTARPKADYHAKTAAGVPLTSAYAIERGANRGLVTLIDRGRRRVKAFTMPHARIRAVVRVRYDQTLPEWADFVFTAKRLELVHTTTANAGIFTTSEVYDLPLGSDGRPKAEAAKGDADVQPLLRIGLAAFDPLAERCLNQPQTP